MAGDAGPAEEGSAVTTRLGMELDERGVPIRSPFKHNPCNEVRDKSTENMRRLSSVQCAHAYVCVCVS